MGTMDFIERLGKIGGLWFATFAGIWVLLDPLGGIIALQNIGCQPLFLYAIAGFTSLLISLSIFGLFYKKTKDKVSDPIEMNTSRTLYD